MLREQQASLLAAIQVVRSAKDPAGQEDRLKVISRPLFLLVPPLKIA